MSYGSDSSPWWGEPTAVTEDAGGVNRTTQTLAYDAAGRATIVQDAANRQITTTYDLDGLIQGVARTDGAGQQIATYTYGSSGITNGVPVQVTDNLSGVTETFGYVSSGPGVGGTASVAESNASYAPDNYTVSYTYAGPSERQTATYSTPYGTTKWAYLDYKAITAGQSGQIARAPQTLNKLDANGNLTDEEMDYSYDGHGRLAEAAFAQSHNTGYTGNLGYEDGTNCYQADNRAHENIHL